MFGAKYQWILAGKYADDWWRATYQSVTAAEAGAEMETQNGVNENDLRCSEQTLRVALNGYICADILVLSLLQQPTVSNLVQAFLSSMLNYLLEQFSVLIYM